jgi:transposase-like protein
MTAPIPSHRPAPPTANAAAKANGLPAQPAQPANQPTTTTTKRRHYFSPSEKAIILSECDTRPVSKVAPEYGVSESMIYRWREKLRHRRHIKRRAAPAQQQPRPAKSGLDAARAALVRAQTEVNSALATVERMRSALRSLYGGE